MTEAPKKAIGPTPGAEAPANILRKTRVFDGFLKVDELVIAATAPDGTPGPEQTRLILERGDSVGVLIYNTDNQSVVFVEQVKAGAIEKGRSRGLIAETAAGMIEPPETPLEAAKREVREETGFVLGDLQPICTFFSSPGGSSERVHLFLAHVKNDDRKELGGGNPAEGEDIRVVEQPLDELFLRLDARELEDPKLIIAAQYLRSLRQPKAAAPTPLDPGTILYRLENSSKTLGIKTGHIRHVSGVDVWVNSENTDLVMDRR